MLSQTAILVFGTLFLVDSVDSLGIDHNALLTAQGLLCV